MGCRSTTGGPRCEPFAEKGCVVHWYWIDRFIEFESGSHAKAVKNVSLAEPYMHDHFAGYPILPKSLVMEGLAQTGGLLVCEYGGFTKKVILAKVPKARFFTEAVPGDRLVYDTTVEYIKEDGAMVTATSHINGHLQAEMEIVFAHLNGGYGRSFEPTFFLKMMRVLGAFEVGAREPSEACPACLAHYVSVGVAVRKRNAAA